MSFIRNLNVFSKINYKKNFSINIKIITLIILSTFIIQNLYDYFDGKVSISLDKNYQVNIDEKLSNLKPSYIFCKEVRNTNDKFTNNCNKKYLTTKKVNEEEYYHLNSYLNGKK